MPRCHPGGLFRVVSNQQNRGSLDPPATSGIDPLITIGRIRREHFIKGKTIREIARDLKVSRNTVRKVLRSGETAFEYERNVLWARCPEGA